MKRPVFGLAFNFSSLDARKEDSRAKAEVIEMFG
jgi:hypothetical protein